MKKHSKPRFIPLIGVLCAMLLALSGLLSARTAHADERTPIETIPLTVNAPVAGTTVGQASNDTDNIVMLESGVPYRFNSNPRDYTEFNWQRNGLYLSSDTVFEEGVTYQLLIRFICDDRNYVFADPTAVTLTGDGVSLNTVVGPGADDGRSTLNVVINVKIPGGHPVSFDMRDHYETTPATQNVADGRYATRPESPVAGDPASDFDDTGLSFRSWINCTPDQLLSDTVDTLSTEGGAVFDFEGEKIGEATTVYACYDGTLTITAYDVTTSQEGAGGKVRSSSVAGSSEFATEVQDTVIEGTRVTTYAEPDDDDVEFLGWSTSTSEDDIVSSGAEYEFEFTQATELYALFKTPHRHTPADPVQENVVDPTCTEPGSYDEVVYCSECGEEISRETISVDPLGHDWGEWEVTTEPTLDAEGEETRVCSHDPSHIETRPIDKLEPEPEPEPTPEPGAETVVITFDLNGGTLDGKTGSFTIEAEVGETITIPDAPTRDGYTFLYWEGSEYNPGDQYEVTGDHTFTAKWKANDAPGSASETDKPAQVPSTGEPASLAGMIALLGGAMVAAGRRLRRH